MVLHRLVAYIDSTFVKWAMTAGATFVSDILLFAFFFQISNNYLLSNILSYISATFLNFTLHTFWTFNSHISFKVASIRYLVSIFASLCISSVLIHFLIQFSVFPSTAKIASSIIMIPYNFAVTKFFVYGGRK